MNGRKLWTVSDIRFLEQHYGHMAANEIDQHIGRTEVAVKIMARKLGCYRKKAHYWSEAKEAVLRKIYQTIPATCQICTLLPGRSLEAGLRQKSLHDRNTYKYPEIFRRRSGNCQSLPQPGARKQETAV